jgi:hypothetical protein
MRLAVDVMPSSRIVDDARAVSSWVGVKHAIYAAHLIP